MFYFGGFAAKVTSLRDHRPDKEASGMNGIRHLIGIALAVALSAGVFFGGTWGYERLILRNGPGAAWSLPTGGGGLIGNSTVTLGLGAVVGTALIVGLLLVIPRISPLATGLPGLVLLAWTVLYLVTPSQAVHYIPLKGHSFGLGFAALGTTGILGAAGIVLVMPLFFPSRWRRSPADDDDYDDSVVDVIEATSVTAPSQGAMVPGDWKTVSSEPTRPVGRPGGK
jgi:hypothetical protein